MAGDGQGNENTKPPIYNLQPPKWLPQISNTVELGFQGFHPPRPGEDEDLLTESNIRQGYQCAQAVPAEAFTSKTLVIATLTGADGKQGDPITELGDFMNEIFKRRQENLPQIPQYSFRVPTRLTLPEAKKQAWFADLANPEIPLYRLGKSVPHGVRGPELLDVLHASNVPIGRAVWFVRVLGCIETTSLKNKPNYNPLQYSVDWATIMNNYLRRQISEIVLPTAMRAGLMIKQSFKGIWTSSDARERWVSKFSYTLDLLRVFYAEYMVDHTSFLTWLVQFLQTCNLAQASFIARVALTYVKDMFPCRALTRMLMDGCLNKLQEVLSSSQKDLLHQLHSTLVTILRRAFYEAPHLFISPRVWAIHSSVLRPILTLEDIDRPDDNAYMKTRVKELKQYLQTQLSDIEQRNEALLFCYAPEPARGCLRSSVVDAQLLNSITSSTDLSRVDFLGFPTESGDLIFSRKLDLLLAWCTSPHQFGSHRPYAAVTLLRLWLDKAEDRTSIHDFTTPREQLQDELFNWLDTSESASDPDSVDNISLVFGELVENNLFSYDTYFQRLIARGEAGLSFEEEIGSRHRLILRTMPLHSQSTAFENQRKFALYGVRVRHPPEEAIEKETRRKIRLLLPEVFGGDLPEQSIQIGLLEELSLMTQSRFEQVRVVKQWFLPALKRHMFKVQGIGVNEGPGSTRLFAVSVAILESLKCYRSMLDITLRALKAAVTKDLLVVVIDALRRHLGMWACMNKVQVIVETAYSVHQSRKSNGEHVRPLVSLILEIDNCRFLDPIARQTLVEEAAHYAQALCPLDGNPDQIPTTLPEILYLSQDPSPDAPSSLSNTLWYKYRTSRKWAWIVWDNVIGSLRQIPGIALSQRDRDLCAKKYAQFLLHVDEHSADGIDTHALKWFVGPGQNEIVSMTPDAWAMCVMLFIRLVVQGTLKITTLLDGVIYPAWVRGTQADSVEKWTSACVALHAANALFRSLLLQSEESMSIDGASPPTELSDMQRLKARRGEVYQEAHFRRLMDTLPALVLIQNNSSVEEPYRSQAHDLVIEICKSPDFCLAALRYFNTVLTTFVRALEPGRFPEEIHNSLMTTLHLVFNNGVQGKYVACSTIQPSKAFGGGASDSSKVSSSILSPWRLSATCALTKFDLRQIAKKMESPATKEQAEQELTQLVERLLHNNISSDEAEFIIEMTKGVSKIISGRFLNCGLRRISQILEEARTADVETMQSMTNRADHFLTLLSNVASPMKGDTSEVAPRLDTDAQDEFMPKLLAKLELMEASIRKCAESTESIPARRPLLTGPVLFVIRLLQYDLGFEGAWTPQTREIGNRLLATVLRLAVLYGGLVINDPVAFSMLLDTAFYIFDELPFDTRQNVVTDIFQHCPRQDDSLLPSCMPPSYKVLIRSLFRHSIHTRPTTSPIDGVPPAQLKPWEWLEYLGDQPLDPKEQEKKQHSSKHVIRNNASLSLELFGAQILGEGIRNPSQCGNAPGWLFEDGLVAESIYERAWRIGHVEVHSEKPLGESVSSSSSREHRGTSTRASPTLSSKSSTGGGASGTSSRHSPFGRDPTDIDNLYPPITGGKRKATAAGIGEDDDTSIFYGKGKGKGKSRQ